MKHIKHMIFAAIFSGFIATGVSAQTLALNCGGDAAGSAACQARQGVNATTKNPGKQKTLDEGFKQIVNVLLFIIGAIAVIMIVVGGLRYVLSGGDSSQIKSAKDTILYAVIGIVVALLAYAIVNWVIDQF